MNVATLNTIFSWIAILSAFLTLVSSVGTYWTGKIMEKPIVEIRPLEINIKNPDPEIGYDSEYELDIITKNSIANFILNVKVPDSVWRPEEPFSIFNDTVTRERAWYENYEKYPVKNGYATFEIPNASGEYHLVFGSTKPEQLTIKDIKW